MTESPIVFITLERPSGGYWTIAASIKNAPPGYRENLVITSTKGLLGTGELSENPIPRSYSNGSVINPRATRAGITFNIPMTFYAESAYDRYSDYLEFRTFCATAELVKMTLFGSGYLREYNIQIQDLLPEFDDDAGLINATLVAVSLEAI